jgi:hypothetical protein
MSGVLSFDIATKHSQLADLAAQYAESVIYCYARPSGGAIPSVDTLDPGVLPCLILTKNGAAFTYGVANNGFNFGSPSGGSIGMDANVYSGVGILAGTLAFFRLWNNAGTRCIQGSIGVSNSVMTCTTTSITVGGPVALTTFTITME